MLLRSFILFQVLTLLAYPTSAQIPFEWLHPKPVGGNIYGVAAFEDGTIVAVGADGLIMRSQDDGVTWLRQPTDTAEHYYAIDVFGDSFAAISGYRGAILISRDRGKSWERLQTGEGYHFLQGLDVLDSNNIIAVGGTIAPSSRVLRTRDGGATWQISLPPSQQIPNDVVLVDSLNAWMVTDGIHVLNSVDGGTTWTEISMDVQLQGGKLYAVDFFDSSYGAVGGSYGAVVVTEDGGETWNVRLLPGRNDDVVRLEIPVPGHIIATATRDRLSRGSSTRHVSTDGGLTWNSEGIGVGILDVTQNPATGSLIAVGALGSVWRVQSEADAAEHLDSRVREGTISHLAFRDRTLGLAVVERRGALVTADGGESWQYSMLPGPFHELYAGDISPTGTLLVGGEEGKLFRSEDFADSWEEIGFPHGPIQEIKFIDDETAWIFAGFRHAIRTIDAGDTWETGAAPFHTLQYAFDALDRSVAVTVGRNGTMFQTLDGGGTWHQIENEFTPNFVGVQVFDSLSWTATYHQGFVSTTDGGATWRTGLFPDVIDMQGAYFRSPEEGWYVTRNIPRRTTDGGITWEHRDIFLRSLNIMDIYLDDMESGWMITGFGGIIRFGAEESSAPFSQLPDSDQRFQAIFDRSAERVFIGVPDVRSARDIERILLFSVDGSAYREVHSNQVQVEGGRVSFPATGLSGGSWLIDIRRRDREGVEAIVIVRR